MAIKTLNESPTIADTVLIDLETTDADGCLVDPYKVNNVTIYFIERDFISGNLTEYETKNYNQDKLASAIAAEKLACTSPTASNIENATNLRQDAEESVVASTFYFNEAIPSDNFGTELFPAWLSTDTDNAILERTGTGIFQLTWEPKGKREGQYFVCWTWTVNVAGDTSTNYRQFDLFSATQITTAVPTHFTDPIKYETLLERYTPNMFKSYLGDADLTPEVIDNFNGAIAKGFTFIEDLANQVIDLLDANVTNESFLNLLANMFNLQLRSDDPTLWRRQIKRAIPLFKRKGTLLGLEEALAQADIALTKLTKLWQVISPYTWVEGLLVTNNGQTEFILDKNPILPIDVNNFELSIRPSGSDDFVDLTSDYTTFATVDGVTTMTWVGHQLSMNPVILAEGDLLKITYETNNVPNTTQQSIEDYIRVLPLADQRDDRLQTYPVKNWNVRVIEEDDPLFDIIIPARHPYTPAVVFGQIRTEFPFSENIYNMDEYNGSLRDSTDPCDIDKDFLDCCTQCLGSKFSVDIEIESLSDDRIIEALSIINEYTPFQAVLHTMNFSGGVEEFVNCGVEEVEALITVVVDENVYCGTAQTIFSRTMENNVWEMPPEMVKRNEAADLRAVVTGIKGTASNNHIVLYAPNVDFQELNFNNATYLNDPDSYVAGTNDNVLEILAPAIGRAGTYTISGEPTKNTIWIDPASPDTISESPFRTGEFTFRLSNIVYTNAVNSISRDDVNNFSDSSVNFGLLGVKTQWDVDNDVDYSGGAWEIKIGASNYTILTTLPDGSLLIDGGVAGSGINYTLLDDSLVPITTSTTGALTVTARGKVVITDAATSDIRILVNIEDYVVWGGSEYKVIGFEEGTTKTLYIDYNGLAGAGAISVYRRLVDGEVGCVAYSGITLTTIADYETNLNIQNGANAPGYPWEDGGFLEQGTGTDAPSTEWTLPFSDGHFKEDFLLYVDGDYFVINDINGTEITLGGPSQIWGTTGLATDFTIYKAMKEDLTVRPQRDPVGPGYAFDFVDRRGKDIVVNTVETGTSMAFKAAMLNAANKNEIADTIQQSEEVSFNIEWASGLEEKGEL